MRVYGCRVPPQWEPRILCRRYGLLARGRVEEMMQGFALKILPEPRMPIRELLLDPFLMA